MRLDKQIKNVENGISVPLKELFFEASQGFLGRRCTAPRNDTGGRTTLPFKERATSLSLYCEVPRSL